jgi:hypothetical protein
MVSSEGVNRLKGTRKCFWSIFHVTSTNIFGHDKIFLDEVQNILPHGQGSNMNTPTILLFIVFICSNGACDLQH